MPQMSKANSRSVSIGMARKNFPALIDEVKRGRTIVLTEHGRQVARLSPLEAKQTTYRYTNLAAFRASVKMAPGTSVSDAIIEEREESEF